MLVNPMIAGKVVAEILAEQTGFTAKEILGPGQARTLCNVRHTAVGVLRIMGYSLPECAKAFGKDHTTSLNSWQKVQSNEEMMRVAKDVSEEARGRLLNGSSGTDTSNSSNGRGTSWLNSRTFLELPD